MADPLADALNRIGTDPQAADTSVPTTAQPGLFRRMMNSAGDYIAGSNPRDLLEAMGRSLPMTSPFFVAKDALDGTLVDNTRRQLGQLARVPTDIIGSVTGAVPAVSAVKQLAFGGDALPGAEGLGQATDAVDDFGKKIGEAIAGQPLGNDVLRGSPAEMSANWMRQLASAIIPVPSKVATAVTAPLAKLTTGIEAVDKATLIAGKTIEALTPMAVDATPKGIALNAGLQGALAPIAEAGGEGLKAALTQQAQADTAAKQAGPAVTQATGELATAPKIIQAGGLPSTGDTTLDTGIVLGAGALMLYAAHRRDLAKRVAEGTVKALSGFDPKNPAEATIQSLGTKFKQQVANDIASLPASLEQTLKSHPGFTAPRINDMIDRFAEDAASRRGAAVSTRMQSFSHYGEYMDTSIKTVPLNDLVMMHQSLPDPKMADRVLWSMQEIDNRQRMIQAQFSGTLGPIGSPQAGAAMRRMLNTPGNPAAAKMQLDRYAVNLYNTSTQDLEHIVQQGLADPAVKEVVDGFHDMMRKSADYMGSQNRFTPKEVAQFKADNPHYVPPRDVDGNYLDPRDPVKNFNQRTGTDVPRGIESFDKLGSPMEILPKYMDEVFRSTEGKKTTRDYMLTMMRARDAGNKYADQILGRDITPSKEAKGDFVTWRDQYGGMRQTEIKDAVVREAIKNATNPTALQLTNGFSKAFSKIYESGAVGALSLASGTLFAPKAALYNITFGTVTHRPAGVAMGWADRLAQDTLGIPLRGDIFTMIPDAAIRAGLNVGSVLVERGARVLHNSVMTDGILTKMWDPATLQKQADQMHAWYKKTAVYDMQQRALLGPASFSAVDQSKLFKDPASALQQKGVIGNTSSFVNDILHAISSAPAMSILAMNKNVDPWKVNSAIRNMSGDPGRSGAFRGPLGKIGAEVTSMTPWGNVYIQSMGKLAQSFSSPDKAAKTMAGITTAVGIPAMMATMYNNNLGPEYARHQFLERTSDQQASSIYIGKEGAHPTEGWEIPIDPLMRPFKWMAEALTGLHLGAFTGEMFKPENGDMKAAFAESMNNRMIPHPQMSISSPFGQGNVLSSVHQQTVLPPVPAVAQTAFAMGGMQLRNYGDARAMPENKRGGFVEGTAADPEKQNLFGMVLPAQVEDVVRGIGASGAGAILNFFTGISKDMNPEAERSGNVTKSLAGALGNQGREYAQRFADSTSELGSGALFHSFRAVTPSQEASAAVVKQKMDTIRSMADAYAATTQKGTPVDSVGNKKIGPETLLGTHPVGAQDPMMQQLAAETAQNYRQFQPTLQEIKQAYAQRQSIQNSNQYTPVQKRALMEEQGYKVIDLNRRLLQDIMRIEQIQSQRYGRPINFSSMNKGTSVTQAPSP